METTPVSTDNQVQPVPETPPKNVPCCSPQNKFICILATLILALIVGAGSFLLGKNSTKETPLPIVKVSPTPAIPTPIPDLTANWLTYVNKDYQYEFKYPNEWNIQDKTKNFIQILNYDINKAPGRAYNPKTDGNLFKIEISYDHKSFDLNEWFESYKTIVGPSGKPGEFFNVKKIPISSGEGLFFEEKDVWTDLLVGQVTFKSPMGGLIHFWSGLNYEGNKNYFNLILSTFRFD